MFLTIQQPEFMPWSAFFEKLIRADQYVALDSVQYQNRYFDNRCRINCQGQAKWLTIPVQQRSREENIVEKQIMNDESWGRKAFNMLYFNYKPAPYWLQHAPFFEKLFLETEWQNLANLNLEIVEYISDVLDIDLQYSRASNLKAQGKGSDLILEICKELGAKQYLSGPFGKDYLDQDAFNAAEIELVFQDYSEIPYDHFNGPYSGPYSVIDLILNKGRDARRHIEQGRQQ